MRIFEAVGKNVVVSLLQEVDEKTEGGIVIPQSVESPQSYGEVLSVGKDCDIGVKAGDVIAFHARAGMDMYSDGAVFKVMKSDEEE